MIPLRFLRLPPGFLTFFTCAFVLALAAAARGDEPRHRTPDEVLLVRNDNSPISLAIAADYAAQRQVTNLVAIRCPDSATNTDNETIALADYTRAIADPIRAYLAVHTNIDFIVLTKGIPIRITGSDMGSCDEHSQAPRSIRGHPSVDSTLAALDYSELPGTLKIDITGSGAIGCAYSNRYWNATEPFSRPLRRLPRHPA